MNVGRPDYNFDYYTRSLTTAVVACGLVAVTCFMWATDRPVPDSLLVMTSGIVAHYFSAHGTLNGRAQGRRIEREELAAKQAAYEYVTTAAEDLQPPPSRGG